MWLGGLSLAPTASAADANPEKADAKAENSEESQRKPTDFTLVPVVGGDSDVGFGGGFIMSLARTSAELEPYLWRVEAAGMITFRKGDDGVQIPFFDNYVLLDLAHLIPRQLGLKLRLSYTHEEDLRYFGLGNASVIAEGTEPSDPRYRYERTHPTLQADLDYELGNDWNLAWGLEYTHNELSVPSDGLLAEDSASPDPDVRRLTQIVPSHGVATFRVGIGWDTRDHEVDPKSGQHHTLRFDFSPGGPEAVPFGWSRVNLAARWYLQVIPDRLTLAYRIVGDSLLGTPPFYELARYDNTYAVGGSKGVRGIPARRYHGKLKVFSNLEVRCRVVSFDWLDKQNTLGVVAFLDGGRVWADYSSLSELDGTGLGLHLGYGGGLRLGAGESFVLRVDVAGSPDADGVSGYLTAGHIF